MKLFWIVFAVSLVFFLIIERLFNSFLVLFSKYTSSSKSAQAKLVMSSQVNVAATFVCNCMLYIVRFWVYLLSWWLFMLVLVIILSIVYVSYEENQEVWITVMKFYNSNIGPWAHDFVVAPLYVINLLFKAVIPLWNTLVWWLKVLVSEGILPILINDIVLFLQFIQALFELVQSSVDGLIAYIQGFDCVAETCLLPGAQVLNLITPMGHVRQLVALSGQIQGKFCTLTSVPYDIIAYPFMDVNFAEGVHFLSNGLMELIINMPYNTLMRCNMDNMDTFHIMMCTPDVSRFFHYITAGIGAFGYVFDNWLNVVLVILQQALIGNAPSCDLMTFGLVSDIMNDGSVFGLKSSSTTVVGLTSWMYAVTDGKKIIYKGHQDTDTKIGAWPYSVNTKYGVAAVAYSPTNNVDVSIVSDGSSTNARQTTSMLGCNCTNGDSGISITCSIAPLDGYVEYYRSDYLLQVLFPNPLVTQGLLCENIDLMIRSVRWSFYRYSTNEVPFGRDTVNMPTLDCITAGTCRQVDATVWVIPRCGTDTGNTLPICLPTSTCFPYCMGVRLTGSTNNNILLAGALTWKEGRTMINVDCDVHAATTGDSQQTQYNMYSTFVSGNTNELGTDQVTSAYTLSNGIEVSNKICYPAPGLVSVVNKIQVTNYGSLSTNTYLKNQPFVVTGDVLFTPKSLGNDISSVVIDRLIGDQENSFSMTSLNEDFPAEPPLNVPAAEFQYENSNKLIIPYWTRLSMFPATTSKNYVFYASNPDYNVFAAYFEYCSKPAGTLGKFGLLITSSYGPIRIYRVKAYTKCNAYSCGADMIRSVDFDEFRSAYSKQCNGFLNTSIKHLEYLNEDNIAVVLESASVNSYSPSLQVFTNTSTTIMWLNPRTMQVSKTIWQTYLPPANAETLCPNMQRMPRLGSFVAEIVNSGVYFFQFLIQIPLYFPGMVPIWQDGGKCPRNSHGHYMLASCGSNILSLEDFFDSLADAQSILWHSLSSIAALIQKENAQSPNPLVDVLNGMAEYGEGSIDLWAVRKSVITLSKIPIKEQLTTFYATVRSGAIFSSGHYVQGNMIVWARFTYKVISDVLLVILRSILQQNQMTSDDIWKAVWTVTYDSKNYYAATITKSNQLACNGIQLMMGLDNPWANLAYYQCVSSSFMIDNVLQTILNIKLYIPMVVCVCKESSGRNVASYVAGRCAAALPMSLRPELYIVADLVEKNQGSFCLNMLDKSREKIKHSMDPWFKNMYLGLYALSDCIDYLLIMFDEHAGKCTDFAGDPHVVSIIPQPVDYFLKCSGTSLCQTKCSAEWEDFQYYKTQPVTLSPFDMTLDSMFFPGQYDSTLTLLNATAIVQVQSDIYCIKRVRNPDYAVAVAEYSSNQLVTRVWCVPQIPMSSVYVSDTLLMSAQTLPGPIMQSFFTKADGSVLALLIRKDSQNLVYWLSVSNGLFLAADEPSISDKIFVNTLNIWPVLETVCVDVLYRNLQTGLNGIESRVYMVHYCWLDGFWKEAPELDLSGFADTHMITLLKIEFYDYYYLLLPRSPSLPVYKVQVHYFVDSISCKVSVLTSFDANSILPSMSDFVLSSFALDPSYVFLTATSGWDWLRQIRINDDTVAAMSSSTPVSIAVYKEGRCDEFSCTGCPSLMVQRLCQSYRKCALVRCIGTLVNENRPLCAVGLSLSAHGAQTLQVMQGGWVVLAEMISMVLKLSTNPGNGLNIEWPHDVFMGYVCSAKDLSVEFWSIITSVLNSMIKMTKPFTRSNTGGNIDINSDAITTLQTTAFNGFLAQITLYPLYQLIVLEQILLCQVNGMLSLVDSSGYTLRIQSASLFNASDVVAGSCLVLSAVVADDSSYIPSQPNVSNDAVSIVSRVASMLVESIMDPFVHVMDGTITYLMGLVYTFANWIMSLYLEKCNTPNYFLPEIIKCACNDTRLSIPDNIASKGINDYALWCTGTLGMIDVAGNSFIIVNPYTYAELRAKAGRMESYIACLSVYPASKCSDAAVDEFKRQGVTLINVLVKCRENYMKKQWDSQAYAYFDSRVEFPNYYGRWTPPSGPIADCLVQSHEQGAGPQACLELYANSQNVHSLQELWIYENAQRPEPQYTDSCLVFSGPGLVHNVDMFKACVDGYDTVANTRCRLNPSVWDVVSSNDVPVAEPHVVYLNDSHKRQVIQRYYENAQSLVKTAVLESLSVWGNESNADVDVEFFSTEGDAIHQILDCIYLGPYSKVDYWPVPAYDENEENLLGPSWWRDENQGASRSMNPDTCVSSDTMPFTCGSPSRKGLIRFFVKNILSHQRGGNANTTLIQRVIKKQLQDIYEDWSNTSLFACFCADNQTHSVDCCTSDSDQWLPENMRRPFQNVNSSHVLDALEQEYEYLYRYSLQNPVPWALYNEEYLAYNWQDSRRAQREGLHNPTNATYNYQENLLNLEWTGSGLWGICHASLKQVFFTLPVLDSRIVNFDKIYDGNPANLESSIKSLLDTALADSPLYRHYHPRYHPSNSSMCKDYQPAETTSSAYYGDLMQAGSIVLQGSDVMETSVQAKSYQYYSMGHSSCFCGWSKVQNKCVVPLTKNTCALVCSLVPCANCEYDFSIDHWFSQNFTEESQLWDCPWYHYGPHWGVLNKGSMQSWMQGQSSIDMASRDLLQYGRAGVRLGNLKDIMDTPSDYINPAQRTIPLSHGVLTSCDYHQRLQKMDAMHLVEELFPITQGVAEGAIAAYCMRYFIEKARFTVLQYTKDLGIVTNAKNYLNQEILMLSWRRKCSTQVYLLHLCVSLDVFQYPMASNQDHLRCLFFKQVANPSYYLTAECLVFSDGVFYDPCRCVECSENTVRVVPIDYLKSHPLECTLSFDPRNKTLHAHMPIGEWEGEHLDYSSLLNEDLLLDHLLQDHDALGNTANGENWKTAEGFMADNSENCDMMTDYWQDTWEHPVGYHVSTSCDTTQTPYRGFMNAFTQTIDPDGVSVFQYENDLMRAKEDIDVKFGIGGLCRQHNFGMPLVSLNTLVYCTKFIRDEYVDMTIPNFGTSNSTDYTNEMCTEDSSELPWDSFFNDDKYASSKFTIGTIPNIPLSSSTTYPENLDSSMMKIGISTAFDDKCKDYHLKLCSLHTPCPDDFYCKGKRCVGSNQDTYVACTEDSDCDSGMCSGVCLSSDVDCIHHADCKNHPSFSDRMCNGLGRCVQPQVLINNPNATSAFAIQFSMRGDTKDVGQNYSLQGASYFGYMAHDLLNLHGMCSYNNWYQYRSSYLKDCLPQSDANVCWLNAASATYKEAGFNGTVNQWWGTTTKPYVFSVRPTVCDRDYERLDGFTLVRPDASKVQFLTSTSSISSPTVSYDKFTRAYQSDHTIALAKFDAMGDSDFVFGTELASVIPDEVTNPFQKCSSIRQCLPSPFTRNFTQVQRTYNNQLYDQENTFTCGSIGVLVDNRCILDTSVLPLYNFFCVSNYHSSSCDAIFSETVRYDTCNSIQLEYEPKYNAIDNNVQALQNLFFLLGTTYSELNQVLKATECAVAIYSHIKNSNLYATNTLYFPQVFILKEVPFDWYYQCLVVFNNPSLSLDVDDVQDCPAYKAKGVSIDAVALINYLRLARVGLQWTEYQNYKQLIEDLGKSIAAEVVSEIVNKYPNKLDLSIPICSRFRRWKRGLGEVENNVISNYYNSKQCSENLMPHLLSILRSNFRQVHFSTEYELYEAIRAGALTGYTINGTTMDIDFVQRNWLFLFSETYYGNVNDTSWQNSMPVTRSMIELVKDDLLRYWGVSENERKFQCIYTPSNTTIAIPNDLLISTSIKQSDVVQLQDSDKFKCVTDSPCPATNNQDLWTCGGEDCNGDPKIPLFSHRGQFACQYMFLNYITNDYVDGNNVDSVSSFFWKELNNRILQKKNALNIPLLSPQVLDFFRDSDWQKDWHFSFSAERSYLLNIQPDTTKPVMCTIAKVAINYTSCNNPHWFTLKNHVNTYYKHDGGIIIPAGKQLKWSVSNSLMLQGFMTMYSATDRSKQDVFLDQLFEEQRVCRGMPDDWKEKVCFKYNDPHEHVNVINPWMQGYYNPYERCDVDYSVSGNVENEVISSAIYTESGLTFPSGMPLGPKCLSKEHEYVTKASPSRYSLDETKDVHYFEYNLCHYSISQKTDCTHDQGLLGGDNGLFVGSVNQEYNVFAKYPEYTEAKKNYRVAANLYENSHWEIPTDFDTGLFDLQNLLWQGHVAPTGVLKVPDHELGIHIIAMTIIPPNTSANEDLSILLVSKLPLAVSPSKENLIFDKIDSQDVQDWVPTLQEKILEDHQRNEMLYSTESTQFQSLTEPLLSSAQCPLVRFAFYGRNHSFFTPVLPSPIKSNFLFSRITGNKLAHPTMTHSQSTLLGEYETVNGFCFCPKVKGVSQTQCKIPISSTGTCSMAHTIDTLKATPGIWFDSYVFPVMDAWQRTKKCVMQTDWPFVNNKLRDGTQSDDFNVWDKCSDPVNKKCHILDRMHSFKYRYKNTGKIAVDPIRNTVSSGVCATGRLSKKTSQEDLQPSARCVMSSRLINETSHLCDDSTQPFILSRPLAMHERQMFTAYRQKRRKCNMCSSLPRFRDKNKNIISAESSVGIPYRLSASRVLATDLRKVLEENNAGHLINEPYWTPSLFMDTYLKSPHLLLLNALPNTTQKQVVNDTDKWQTPWVYCPNVQAFQSKNCMGSISRENWIANKVQVCPAMIKSFMQNSENDPMSHASFANIDKSTNKVALAIAEAREAIIAANCIASGQSHCQPMPYVYHPASYESTNQEWVHNTVFNYYNLLSPSTCATTTTAHYAALAADQQLKCPAKNLYFFYAFLDIIRKVVRQAAKLIASLVSLFVKLLAAAFSVGDSKIQAVSSLKAEWASTKTESSDFFSNLSDLMVSMIMNSGKLGVLLKTFLTTSCNKLDNVLMWLGKVWCNVVLDYLPAAFDGIRRFTGGVSVAFTFIQAFLLGLLKDILPLNFISKYVAGAGTAILSDRFSQPTDKSKRNEAKVVPASGTSKISRVNVPDSRLVNALKTTGKFLGGIGSNAMTITATVGISMLLDWAVESMIQAQKDEIIPKLWPSDTNMFDFSDVIDVIDNVAYVLSGNEQCNDFRAVSVNRDYIIKCPTFDIDPTDSTNPAKSMNPTMCWATATTSLGQSSSLTCSAASTCCPAEGCSSSLDNLVLCNDCPVASTGNTHFACENMACTCGVPIRQIAYCASNAACSGSSMCDLISSISDVSYGSIECNLCPGRVLCLAKYAGMSSKCSCVLDSSFSLATCKEKTGTITYANPLDFCVYLPNSNGMSADNVFLFDDMMMVQCKYSTKTVCSSVYMDDGVQMNLALAYSARMQSGRRLLAEDMGATVYTYENEYDTLTHEDIDDIMHLPLWNQSSAPCSHLAHAYQMNEKLGIMDDFELRKCAFWRFVGQRMISDLNLTTLRNRETFLISMDDLAYAIMQKDVLLQILGAPHFFPKLLLLHPYMKPVRAALIVFVSIIDSTLDQLITLNKTIQKQMHAIIQEVEKDISVEEPIKPRKIELAKNRTKGRKLLTTMSEIQAVQEYSAQVLQGKENPPLPLVVAQAWTRYQPNYMYSISQCTILSVAYAAGKETLVVMVNYYQHIRDPIPVLSRALRDNLPQMKRTVVWNVTKQYKSWPSWVYYSLLDVLQLNIQDIQNFLVGRDRWSLQWIIHSSIMCDFGSLMSCSRHHYDLFTSIFVFVIFYFIIYYFSSSLGVPSLATLFLLSFPFFMLWYVYGVSPNCLPMLPPCLLDDVVRLGQDLFPSRFSYPSQLYCNGTLPEYYPNSTVCLKSCSEFGFVDMWDPLVYAFCYTYPDTCQNGINWLNASSIATPLVASMTYMHEVVVSQQDLSAYTFCMFINTVKTLPLLFLLILIVPILSSMLYVLLSVIPSSVLLVSHVLSFTHTYNR